MIIRKATVKDVPLIHDLAEKIWWPTYQPILSDEQISFMLKDMYSEDALNQQIKEGAIFIIVSRENTDVAFAGYSIETDESVLKIHKIYVLPSEQGKGTGKKLIEHLKDLATGMNLTQLELNVNRGNPALDFYQKLGFEIKNSVDIPYHQFVLNDYVMRLVL